MVDRDFKKNPLTRDEIVNCYWYAVPDDTIGGWSVSNVPEPVSQLNPYSGRFELGSFMTEYQAKHIAEIHNKWMQDQAYATYRDNIEFSWVQSIFDFYEDEPIPLPEGVVPLTEDELRYYDDRHEAS